MVNKSIGQKVKFFRKKAGLSQLELEFMIQASPGTICRLEKDKVNPTKETLINIAKVLKLNPQETASLFDIEIRVEEEYVKILANKVLNLIKEEISILTP